MQRALVIGTGLEIIKTVPVIRTPVDTDELDQCQTHTDQHYDKPLSKSFFLTLEPPGPDEYLWVGSGIQHAQTAEGLRKVGSTSERTRTDRRPCTGRYERRPVHGNICEQDSVQFRPHRSLIAKFRLDDARKDQATSR